VYKLRYIQGVHVCILWCHMLCVDERLVMVYMLYVRYRCMSCMVLYGMCRCMCVMYTTLCALDGGEGTGCLLGVATDSLCVQKNKGRSNDR